MGPALALLFACALLAGAPASASAHASLGSRLLFHAADDPSLRPDDQYFGKQWALEDYGPQYTMFGADDVADADIDATQAWQDADAGDGSGVVVGVVDTAVDVTHDDLAGQIVTPAANQADFAPADSCANATPKPDHGTAIAGIVAALRGNGFGIAGIAPGAKILPVRALDNCGEGTLDSVSKGFEAAAAQGAKIVVGSFATDPWLSRTAQATIAARFEEVFAEYPGTLFVVAAGNEGNDNDRRPVYPCNARADNMLCVAASNMNDGPRCSSNYGAQSVDLFAPGDRIWSTVRPDVVAEMSGTSMAAPMVAGVAALVWPTLVRRTAANVADALRTGVDPRATMTAISIAGGRLNAAGALNAASAAGLAADDEVDPALLGSACADMDGDGVNDVRDDCPDTAGDGPQGCPVDTDSDGVPDASDNCPAVANPGQEDADGDRVGNACDPDRDGDGVPNAADGCPDQANATSTGCPYVAPPAPSPTATPTPAPPVIVQPVVAPRIVSVSVTVAHSRRSARVTVRLSRTLPATVTAERRVRRHHHRVWARVLRRSVTFTAAGRSMTVRTRSRGSYRVTVRVTGAPTVRRNFRV